MEQPPRDDREKIDNVSAVPHRSPFRYPGGKTWLVRRVRLWLRSLADKPTSIIEPFAGGAIIGLSAVFDEQADGCVLVERDEDVGFVWQAILDGGAEELQARIQDFQVTAASVRTTLDTHPISRVDRAFRTLLRNRVSRGGILAPGASLMKRGENDHGLASRWYPQTLAQRIHNIAAKRDRIHFVTGDGLTYLREHAQDEKAVWFVDPPYSVAGRRLYTHSEMDHDELFRLTAKLRGDFLMTYDDSAFIRRLAAEFDLETQTVAMKNTHNAVRSELLIGRDLSWARLGASSEPAP